MHGLFLEGAGWEDGKGEDEAAFGSSYLWLVGNGRMIVMALIK